MRLAAALPALLLSTATFAAAPPIDTIDVARSGDDLVISWTPPATPVDGFRVYKSDNADCAGNSLLYDGSATSFTVTNGLAQDFTAAVYRIVAYIGIEEGPVAGPVYKYEVMAPGGIEPRDPFGAAVSVPRNSSLGSARDLCIDANGAPGLSEPLKGVARFNSDTSTFTMKFCATGGATPGFSLTWPASMYMHTIVPASLVIWGHGQGDETISLPIARRIYPGVPPSPDAPVNLYRVSLPYDHDYADLAALAADVPNAVDVRLWTGRWVEDPVDHPYYGEGLTRASSLDPWTGTNYALSNRRGEGILIAVDAPTTWIPRRRCTGPITAGPGPIRRVTASAQGDDLALGWTPDALAAGGYSLYRVTDKTALPRVLDSTPLTAVPEATPAFPILDPGAMLLPGLHLYQVVGRGADGSPGGL